MAVTTGQEPRQIFSERGLSMVVDFAVQSHARAAMILVVVALLNILPGFVTIPPTDRDEARFAQATKQMLETGDYVDIRFQDEVRYKKPVGIYWLQAAAVKAGSALGMARPLTTIWLYRIPSLIGALAAVLLTYWTALAFVGRRPAFIAGLMMATCLLLSIEGRIAKTDAMLLATVVAAMGALARLYLPEQRKQIDATWAWLLPGIFWTALAGGVLIKGPVIVMVVVLAIGALAIADRSLRWLALLRPVAGFAWFAVLVLPWFLAIVLRAGDSFFAESIGSDLMAKVATGQESHGAPPGYYFLLFWVTFWPGAMLAGLAAPAIYAARREPGAKFLLAWLVPTWIVLELVVTKLPHYVLPLYPAAAILIAGIVDARMLSTRTWLVRGTLWWFVIPLLIGIAGIVVLIFVGRQFGLLVWPVIGAAAIMGVLAWQLYEGDGPEQSLLRGAAAAILTTIAIFGLIAPSIPQLFPSATLANILRQSGCRDPLAASVGFHEPSVVFLAGTSTRLTDGPGAAEFLRGGECRFAFVEARQERSFAQRADVIGLRYFPQTRVEAININMSNGHSVTMGVYRSGSSP
jgi:4-amino-4-deoxy-L-arabinose transferase-like glycosyltransferase